MTAPKGEAYNPPEICISTTVTLRLEQQKKCYYNCEVPMRGGNFELVLNQSDSHLFEKLCITKCHETERNV